MWSLWALVGSFCFPSVKSQQFILTAPVHSCSCVQGSWLTMLRMVRLYRAYTAHIPDPTYAPLLGKGLGQQGSGGSDRAQRAISEQHCVGPNPQTLLLTLFFFC